MLKKRGGGEELPSKSVTKKQKTKKHSSPAPPCPGVVFQKRKYLLIFWMPLSKTDLSINNMCRNPAFCAEIRSAFRLQMDLGTWWEMVCKPQDIPDVSKQGQGKRSQHWFRTALFKLICLGCERTHNPCTYWHSICKNVCVYGYVFENKFK